jgi:GNAT superfamily N-acetyltransferase
MTYSSVQHEKTLANSKAFAFVIREYADLIERGHGDNELAFGNSNKVSYILAADGSVVAASVWYVDEMKRSAWILFSATKKQHQGQGLYTQLYNFIEDLCKKQNVVAIYSGVHVDNQKMIDVAKSVGRMPNSYRVKKML